SSAAWVDNFSRTSAPADQKDGSRYTAALTASTFRNWKTGVVTSAEVAAMLEHVPDFTRAGAFTSGVLLGARRKFGLGAFAPALDLSAGASYRDARHPSAAGWSTTAGARLSKRLSRAWRVAALADWHNHAARHTTFDTRHHRVSGTVSWDVTNRWQLSYGAGRLQGNFTANAAPVTWARALAGDFGSAVANYYNTVARERTEIFGPGWVSYRVDGRAHQQWLELSPALGRNTSLPLRLERIDATNIIGVKYRQELATLTLLHRF
ncbi:MAG TPA: hypothetical protein VEQ65_06290, partial [Opitutus sp.]|nr:hypothetical protein [Opitutus sp.]